MNRVFLTDEREGEKREYVLSGLDANPAEHECIENVRSERRECEEK